MEAITALNQGLYYYDDFDKIKTPCDCPLVTVVCFLTHLLQPTCWSLPDRLQEKVWPVTSTVPTPPGSWRQRWPASAT